MAQFKTVALTMAILLSGGGAWAEEVPGPETTNAYKTFWESFDAYERELINEGESKYQQSWKSIKDIKEKHAYEFTLKQIENLDDAAYEYQQHLKKHPQAHNRPYVYLNLAQILSKIADLKESMGEDGSSYTQEALAVLDELEKSVPEFEKREATLYLKGLLLSKLGADKTAVRNWQKLSVIAKNSLYGVHAKIAVGDYLFKTEKPIESLRSYKSALSLLRSIHAPNKDHEILRIQYRIIWASYRSANLKTAIETGIQLLQPGRYPKADRIRDKITSDALQLIGDALYEFNNPVYTKSILKRQIIAEHASTVSLRVLQNYLANKIYEDITDIGSYTLRLHPVSKVAPDIVTIVADAYEKSGQKVKQIKTLERLAQFLAKQSLWRSRHAHDFEKTQAMEEQAEAAALMISKYYYEQGMASGNPRYFESAETFFNILIQHRPNHQSTSDLKLKRGHSLYFSDRYVEASRQYEELIGSLKVKHSILKIASHQNILAREKIWRQAYSKAEQKTDSPEKYPPVVQELRHLEKAIEQFANRFPPKLKDGKPDLAVDALLTAAAANRDSNDFKRAGKYWQRVLISNPTSGQRAIAIRGLVLAKVQSGTPHEVVQISRRYLRLENWRKLGLNLGNELRGILAQAVMQEAKILSEQGKMLEAGELQLEVATEFSQIPQRAKIWRDGSYMLAIGGAWLEAERYSQLFLDNKIRPLRGDMAYLKARAQEYQMRFEDASISYFQLAKTYSRHKKSPLGLERSERLAKAESNYILAGQAAALAASRLKNRQKKLNAYKRAFLHYTEALDYETALKIAQTRYRLSRSISNKLSARLDLANAYMKVRDEGKALTEYNTIAKRARSNRARINKATYQNVVGEVHFRLAQEAQAQLHDFNIAERGGDLRQTINQKIRYFEKEITELNSSIRSGHPMWSAQSRFLIGHESEGLADELQSIARTENMTDGYRSEIISKSEQLRKLARTQYSANLLAQSRNPQDYLKNPWIKKSKFKLGGFDKVKTKIKLDSKQYSPPALSLNIPQVWSHP